MRSHKVLIAAAIALVAVSGILAIWPPRQPGTRTGDPRLPAAAGTAVVGTRPPPPARPAPTTTTTPPPTTALRSTTTRPTPPPRALQPTTTTEPPAAPRRQAPPPDEGFPWLPPGPADPGDPAPYRWYAAYAQGKCDAEPPKGPLWEAVDALCDAAVDGETNEWAHAKSAAASAPAPSNCLETAATALLRRALAWHEKHPGDTKPVIRLSALDDTPACALAVLDLTTAPDNLTCAEALAPQAAAIPAGPVTGGTRLLLTTTGTDRNSTKVTVGGLQAKIDCLSPTRVIIRTPPSPRSGRVTITVTTSTATANAPAQFEYLRSRSDTTTTPMPRYAPPSA
ncbi:hypothetical protein GCM10022243_54750 [Saccharothrix violaceirubra]|uniref:IPT/TIG domain-containing protein n=1 Tax=Saccharothrix violaceirubra TaxID=413306 RepID=A0A7W7T5J3_9PSEU|nr:IPT/TIG domain-containing protein [Saccharothrix violaceirubra]MBB4966988.1 hypothetical protein [Saccharothrix violaceirubra]